MIGLVWAGVRREGVSLTYGCAAVDADIGRGTGTRCRRRTVMVGGVIVESGCGGHYGVVIPKQVVPYGRVWRSAPNVHLGKLDFAMRQELLKVLGQSM